MKVLLKIFEKVRRAFIPLFIIQFHLHLGSEMLIKTFHVRDRINYAILKIGCL